MNWFWLLTYAKIDCVVEIITKYPRIFIYQVRDRLKEKAKAVYMKAFTVYNLIKDCFKGKDTQYFSIL